VDGGLTIGPRHAWSQDSASPVMEALGLTPEQLNQLQGGPA
jgi:hypothetical protein